MMVEVGLHSLLGHHLRSLIQSGTRYISLTTTKGFFNSGFREKSGLSSQAEKNQSDSVDTTMYRSPKQL